MTLQYSLRFLERDSQNSKILAALKSGRRLTPLIIFAEFNCLRASGRIYDLVHGKFDGTKYPVKKDMVTVGNGKRVAEYFMEDEAKTSYDASG